MIDLHIHTTASDGTDAPSEVVKEAAALGLTAIAVTDHDCVNGIAEAQRAGQELGVEVIPGLEVSCDYLDGNVHILGYFFDPEDPILLPVLNWARNEREERNRKMTARLCADGFDISLEELKALHPGTVIGRPHMAALMMQKGYASSIADAFNRYLDENGPYYLPKRRIPLELAADVITDAGGVAVLAHPMQYGFKEADFGRLLMDTMSVGVRAVECYYSEHCGFEQGMLLDLAEGLGMGVSGGSDYHGTNKPHIRMGIGINRSLYVPDKVLTGLKQLRTVIR